MALTGLTPIQITNLNVSGIATFEQAVGVGGTLTYQDVTNVDAVGIITARVGVNVPAGQLDIGSNIKIGNSGIATASNFKTGSSNLHSAGVEVAGVNVLGADTPIGVGATIYNSGGAIFAGTSGVVTATTFSGSGASLTNLPAANLTGTLPAISGANLTSLPAQATVNNNADNRVITGGSGVNLYAESGFTYDGTIVQIPDRINLNTAGTYIKSNQIAFNPTGTAYLDHYRTGQDIQIRMSTSSSLDTTGPTFKSNGNLAFASGKGIDFSATGDGSGSMTSELLDDYEEGSFTPQFEGLSNTPAYAVRTGKYTKVGRLVHITGIIQAGGTNPTFTTTSDILKITGLPYAGTGVMYYVSLGNVSHQGWNCLGSGNNEQNYSSGDIDFMNCQMEHNTSKMLFIAGKSGNSRARIRNASVHNQGFIMMFELSYTAA